MPSSPIRAMIDVDRMEHTYLAKLFRSTFDKRAKTVQRQWAKEVKPKIKKMIIKRIQSGKSPVARMGEYAKYSRSYKRQILKGRFKRFSKRITPVNLRLSGKLLKSIRTVDSKNGFEVYFKSPIAKYHDEDGAGKSRTIRRMLPGGGENFTRDISNMITQTLFRVLRRNL